MEKEGIIVKLPYQFGQFVRIKETNAIGTINAYTVFEDGILVWVSGYKQSWCGEFEENEFFLLKKEEELEVINKYKEYNNESNQSN